MKKWNDWNIGEVSSRNEGDWLWFASTNYLMDSLGMNKDSALNGKISILS